MVRFFFLTVLTFLAGFTQGQGFLRANGQQIVDEAGRNVLLRGIGLGGWMLQEPYMLQLSGVANNQTEIRQKISELVGEEKSEMFYTTWLSTHCRKADIDSLAVWGFNSVRLPMHYNLYTLPIENEPVRGQDTWIQKGFALTDSLLAWCKANQMYLILDLHAAPGGQGKDAPIADYSETKPSLWESDENKRKTIALWQKLAQRYANEPWIGGYDLINETNWGFTNPVDKNGCAEKDNTPLRNLLKDITTAIREVDTTHLIFLEANCWANNYNGIFPLWDKNLAVSFHKYWNENQQGSIQRFLEIRKEHNVPIWLGESGENSNVWYRNAIALMEENNIGWAWWPLKKLGINNPVQIVADSGYAAIVNYWKGFGPKPSAEDAFRSFLALAQATKIENGHMQKDVIDAMFRQVRSTQTTSFTGDTLNEEGIIYAVNYDLGRNGFAYYDIDSANYRVSTGENIEWNKGHRYRNDGVDITDCVDSLTNGFAVGWTQTGEWLQWTVVAEKEGTYALRARYRPQESKAQLMVSVNDQPLSPVVLPGKTITNWQTVQLPTVQFKKGRNRLVVKWTAGGADLNYLHLRKVK